MTSTTTPIHPTAEGDMATTSRNSTGQWIRVHIPSIFNTFELLYGESEIDEVRS